MTISINDSTTLGSGGTITDADGNVWSITGTGQVAVNGVPDPTTANVLELAYVNGEIWQKNSADIWWSKTSPNAAWEPPYGTSVPPLPVTASPNDTVAYPTAPNSTTTQQVPTVVDASGNTWTINASGQVAVNGVVDQTTANVVELAYVNGTVWQQNSSGLWWSKTSPASAWEPPYGTSANPIQGVDLSLTSMFGVANVGDLSATGSGSNVAHTLDVPTGTALTTTGIDLTNYSLVISTPVMPREPIISGNSTLIHSSLEVVGPPPMGPTEIANNGIMTLSASTLTISGATGTGTIVATNNSTINLTGQTDSNTIKLTSGHLYLSNYLASPNAAMNFLAPITGFNAASEITLNDVQATSEVFAKTSLTAGDLFLYNGTTEVANLHISGSSMVYASIVQGSAYDSILLTSTKPAHPLPIST
ncbi:MAG: hypothetical protein QOG73_2079 [Acetobacteraceae bacterium]|nr:hypothetical protein [Acetobacteraceae bacterium]